jgi:hypothetical protein
MKIYRHKVEAEMRAKHDPTLSLKVSAGYYEIAGKKSLNTALSGLDLIEAVTLLNEEFAKAAKEFEVPVSSVTIQKGQWGGEKVYLTATRLETPEERERDFQYSVDKEVANRRRLLQNKKNAEYQKKRQIKKLQEELEKLTKE